MIFLLLFTIVMFTPMMQRLERAHGQTSSRTTIGVRISGSSPFRTLNHLIKFYAVAPRFAFLSTLLLLMFRSLCLYALRPTCLLAGTPIGSPKSHKSYRPLTVATFKATYYFFGLYPTVFHGLNCLLHATVSAAVLFLASAIYALLSTPPRSSTSSSSTSTFSLVVALVFALHPLHGDAVASIVGRAELLYSLLLLCSLYTYSVSISMAPPARFSLSTFPSSDRTHDDSSPRSSSLALAATHTTSSALVYASEWDPLGDRSPVAGPRFVDSLLFASYSWTLAWLATLAKEQGVTAFGLMAAMELAAMTFPALTNTLSPQLQHKQQQCRRIPGLSRMALLRLSVTVSHVALAWWFRAWLNVTPPSFKPIDAPVAHAPDTWTWLLSAAWSWGKAWQLLFAPFTALPPAPVVADSNPFFLSSLTRMFQIFSSDYSGTPLLTSADPTVEPRVYVAVLGAALFLGALLYQIGFTLVYFFPALICHVQCALAGGDGSTSLSSSSSSPAAAAAPGPRLWLALFAASLLYTMPFLPASHLILDVGFFFAERVLYLPSLGMILTVAVVVHAATDKTISLLQKGTNVDSVSSAPQEPAKPSQTVSTSASIATSTSISASSSHVSASRSGKSKASNPPSTTTTTTTDSAPAVTTSSSVLSASSTHAHGSSSAEASKASPPSSTGAAVTVVVVVAVAALALVALLVGSVSRSAAWADPSSMWVQDAQTSPSSAKLATTQCADLAAAGDLSAAQKPCERAVELDPKFVLGRSNLCALYVKQGRLEDAERECVAALGADATWSAAHASLCVIHEARGELESAAARCRASLAANEQQPAVHALACIVLRKLDEYVVAHCILSLLMHKCLNAYSVAYCLFLHFSFTRTPTSLYLAIPPYLVLPLILLLVCLLVSLLFPLQFVWCRAPLPARRGAGRVCAEPRPRGGARAGQGSPRDTHAGTCSRRIVRTLT